MKKIVRIVHKKQTDEEAYQSVKKLYEMYPDIAMNPKIWKKRRLLMLKKEGMVWSK